MSKAAKATTRFSSLKIRNATTFGCLLGIILSYYAYFVETKKATDAKYEAMCDISEHVSCSKVFTSEYGTGFGLMEKIVGKDSPFNQPNGIYGLLFYSQFLFLSIIDATLTAKIQICLGIVSNALSVYLACILYFVLYDFCVVCISTYVINACLLYLSLKKHSLLRSVKPVQKKDKKRK